MRDELLRRHLLENRGCKMIREFRAVECRTATWNRQHSRPKPFRMATGRGVRKLSEDVHGFALQLRSLFRRTFELCRPRAAESSPETPTGCPANRRLAPV